MRLRPADRVDRARHPRPAVSRTGCHRAPPVGDALARVRNPIRRRRLSAAGAAFDWPAAPCADGRSTDLRRLTSAPRSSAYTAHLVDPSRRPAFFVAFSPTLQLAFGYVWDPGDFPWVGMWEENYSRSAAPWSGRTLARGIEFGISPFPETRRAMVERGRLFDTPTYRWLTARSGLEQ